MSASLLSLNSLRGFEVYDREGSKLGTIADLMLRIDEARARYAVLEFEGEHGANKLFAVPLSTLRLDTENECFVLGLDRGTLAARPGFAPDNPPQDADPLFAAPHSPASRFARRPPSA